MFKLVILIILSSNCLSSYFIKGPITSHFNVWLQYHGYEDDDFVSSDFGNNGSFGGKDFINSAVEKRPIVFIHGNSDGALDDGTIWGSGWNSYLETFIGNNYRMSELYGITWGDRNYLNGMKRTFNCKEVMRIRRFLIAVLEYTKFNSINVVAHSMGVTFVRKAIKGGKIDGIDGNCDIGKSLSHKINTFVSLSGANYGLCLCNIPIYSSLPSCNKKNGFWPGNDCSFNSCTQTLDNECPQMEYSQVLQSLNEDGKLEGRYVLNIFSTNDDLIGNGNMVFNNFTSRVPFYTEQLISKEWTHMETKEKSPIYAFNMIKKHDHININFIIKTMKLSAKRYLVFISGNKYKIKDVIDTLPSKFKIEVQDLPIKEVQGSVEDVAFEKCLSAVTITQKEVLVEDTSLCFDHWKVLPGPYIKSFVSCLASLDLYKLASILPSQKATLLSTVTFGAPPTSGSFTPRIFMFTGIKRGIIVKPRDCENSIKSFEPVFRSNSSGLTITEENETGARLKYSPRADALKSFAKAYEKYLETKDLDSMKEYEINHAAFAKPETPSRVFDSSMTPEGLLNLGTI
uniref:Lipase n=1 Tax=Parastrongyloides trichosuri TaxID=131310 RepID=A0A0N5A6J8_PARTI